MTIDELLEEAKKDVTFYRHSGGGVIISGGEPLLNPDFTLKLLRALGGEGINVGVDTCGHVPWASIEPMLPYIDFFLWDIKHMDPEKHRELTGVSNKLILSNARSISEKIIPLYIRVPVIPDYNDSEENIRATCEFAQGLSSVVEVNLIPLHHLGKARYDSLSRPYPIPNIPLIPDSVFQNMKRLVESWGFEPEKCLRGASPLFLFLPPFSKGEGGGFEIPLYLPLRKVRVQSLRVVGLKNNLHVRHLPS